MEVIKFIPPLLAIKLPFFLWFHCVVCGGGVWEVRRGLGEEETLPAAT